MLVAGWLQGSPRLPSPPAAHLLEPEKKLQRMRERPQPGREAASAYLYTWGPLSLSHTHTCSPQRHLLQLRESAGRGWAIGGGKDCQGGG